MAYNPINTRASDGAAGANTEDGVAAPDSVRAPMFTSAGIPEFYGVSVMEVHELGPNAKFTKIFNVLRSAAVPKGPGVQAASTHTFADTDDLVLGIDRSRDAFVKAVAVDGETGSEFSLVADDQYSIRQAKVGWFGSIEEGRVILDDRAIVGCSINRT